MFADWTTALAGFAKCLGQDTTFWEAFERLRNPLPKTFSWSNCRWEVFGNRAHFGKQAGPVWEGFEKLGKGLGILPFHSGKLPRA